MAPFIYLLLPFSFFFDRLATADTLLSFLEFSVSICLYGWLKTSLDLSMLLGVSLGLAWLTKSPAVYFIVLSLVTFVLFRKDNLKRYIFPYFPLL